MRIHHSQALKFLLSHEFIDLCPSKMDPNRYKIRIFREDFVKGDIDIKEKWKKLLNNFRWYNCSNETGGIAYYTGEKNEEHND